MNIKIIKLHNKILRISKEDIVKVNPEAT